MPVVDRDVEERLVMADPDIGNGNVHAAQFVDRAPHHALHGDRIADVGLHRDRLGAEATRLARHGLDGLDVAVTIDDERSRRRAPRRAR